MKKWLGNLLKTYFINIFPFLVVFLANLYPPSDSDLGWHLKYGEYFFQHFSVLRKNIFSTEMTDYQWVNSSWATDLLSYLTFKYFGFLGLSILGGLVITFTLYFFSKAFQLTLFEKAIILPLMVYLIEPLFTVSFRGHLLTLFFLSILYFLFNQYSKGRKKLLFFALPLFTLWSNFHGEFILGISLFLLWILSHLGKYFIFKKPVMREIKFLGSIFLLSLLFSLINPFGIDIYFESIKHFDHPLQKYIIEWLPADRGSLMWWNLIIWGGVLLLSLLIMKLKKQLIENLPLIIITLVLYLLSLQNRRFAWPMYFTSISIVAYLVKNFTPKKEKISKSIAFFFLTIFYLHTSFIKFPQQRLSSLSWERYCQEYVLCSPKSAEFLQNNKITGKMLTFYNWGGWLIWNYPTIKPSIDGRMHLWQEKNGYSAFLDYYSYEQNWKDIDNSQYTLVYITPKKPLYKQMIKKVQEGKWEILYQDNFAYIFRKKKI